MIDPTLSQSKLFLNVPSFDKTPQNKPGLIYIEDQIPNSLSKLLTARLVLALRQAKVHLGHSTCFNMMSNDK